MTDYLVARFGAKRGYGFVPLLFLPLAGALLVAVTFAPSVVLAVGGLTLAFFATEITEGPYWAATMRSARALGRTKPSCWPPVRCWALGS